jgi:hypothetical protein
MAVAEAGDQVRGGSGMDFGVFLQKQYDDYSRIIREANIKVE